MRKRKRVKREKERKREREKKEGKKDESMCANIAASVCVCVHEGFEARSVKKKIVKFILCFKFRF